MNRIAESDIEALNIQLEKTHAERGAVGYNLEVLAQQRAPLEKRYAELGGAITELRMKLSSVKLVPTTDNGDRVIPTAQIT